MPKQRFGALEKRWSGLDDVMGAVADLETLRHATAIEAANPRPAGDARHQHSSLPGLLNVADLYPSQKAVFSPEILGAALIEFRARVTSAR